MQLWAAIRREERRLEKQVGRLQRQLEGVKAAAKALGHTAEGSLNSAGKTGRRALSAAARAKISKAAKKRWAKFRAEAKRVAS